MIQRIQTLYLLLAAAAISLTLFFPISIYEVGELRMVFFVPDRPALSDLSPSLFIPLWPLFTGIVLVAGLCLISVFLYKKRRYQMKFVMTGVLLNILLIIGVFMMADRLTVKLNNSISQYAFGAFLPIIALVFLLLAYRGIRKDERLVRSADRLR